MLVKKKCRVFIVDDSMLFRISLSNRLEEDPFFQVVGIASDPMEAIEKIKAIRPDVVTLDAEISKMTDNGFLKKIMLLYPMPVVVVSLAPITTRSVMDAGAAGFIKKPDVNSSADFNQFMRELAVKLKIASIAKVEQKKQPEAPASKLRGVPALTHTVENMVIAIGASIGGTEAILAVVKDFPPNAPGIVVVQHMPPVFTRMYAERLNSICHMTVKEAQDGDRVESGKIIIGAGGFHLRLKKDAKGYYVRSERGEKFGGHCPSVDVLFESVAQTAKNRSIGVILTGMGTDGANGLLQMKEVGAYTIGQNKENCIVYGMPLAAFNTGAVKKQLPLNQIGDEILTYLKSVKPI
ncbi:MAG: chemotaxis-specific protein-glutamate methyltransferase CheB [Candidatus Fimivivens sp.]